MRQSSGRIGLWRTGDQKSELDVIVVLELGTIGLWAGRPWGWKTLSDARPAVRGRLFTRVSRSAASTMSAQIAGLHFNCCCGRRETYLWKRGQKFESPNPVIPVRPARPVKACGFTLFPTTVGLHWPARIVVLHCS